MSAQPATVPSLLDFLDYIHPLSEGAKAFVAQRAVKKKVKRGKFLVKSGEYCRHIYYIHSGVIRSFLKEGGKEITTWVDLEGEISTSIRGLCYRAPSLENLQTLEDCELTLFEYEDLDYLYENFNEANILGRKFLEASYVAAEERAYLCRIPNAKKKYLHLLETRPEIINRIPLKYTASFLGMTLETLSRIRNAMKPAKK
ncbi:Crp/Fnr family transcriptional regulator [Parasegetibacter sp. NRK P23]|uniref:Crp/Fnr family transcriptional regulator n=1 Tax=Parasegetibacter sp. NRK P23 TaxID=2942999 RepID=UPI002042E3EA|nr:Crp/Fnr family transcriptional regulator [Parasegetibacter sp. NRK P23]MCM5528111.1 Crp/Fnr family transcriptional regulator [Parasegetibacter sp. NRK P23]